ncbi:MAG: hypothetical protein RLZ81_2436 [Pseudomonadota bacterium]|jgi:hypothetical protein
MSTTTATALICAFNIRRIDEACLALPAFQRAAPQVQPDAA